MVLTYITVQLNAQPIRYHSALRFQQKEYGSMTLGQSFVISLTFADYNIRFIENAQKICTALIHNGSGSQTSGRHDNSTFTQA